MLSINKTCGSKAKSRVPGTSSKLVSENSRTRTRPVGTPHLHHSRHYDCRSSSIACSNSSSLLTHSPFQQNCMFNALLFTPWHRIEVRQHLRATPSTPTTTMTSNRVRVSPKNPSVKNPHANSSPSAQSNLSSPYALYSSASSSACSSRSATPTSGCRQDGSAGWRCRAH